VEDADDEFPVVFYTVKIMCYIRCYLTETSMIMNCDTDAMNAFSHPMTLNETLFTENGINTLLSC